MTVSKKLLTTAVALILTLTLLPTITLANNEITVTINNQPIAFADQGPVIVDGRTLVPVAGVFQALGFTTQWDGDTRQVTITRGSDTIVVTIDSSTFTTNYINHNLDVPAQIINGRTMLPIATMLRSVGYEVSWDGESRTVAITFSSQAMPEPTPEPEPDVTEEADYAEAQEEVEEAEEVTPEPTISQALVGSWNWSTFRPFYVFEADGSGMMVETPINWVTSNGLLFVCVTPDVCGDRCIAPDEWYYVVDGDTLTLTSRTLPMTYVYTRVQSEPVISQVLVGSWDWSTFRPFYIFEANGSGMMVETPINWVARNNVLFVCVTPDSCGDNCIGPDEWYYVVVGDTLTLTSRHFPVTYTYTRAE